MMIKRLVCILFFAMLYVVVFRYYLSSDSVLLTTDAVIRGSNVTFGEVVYRLSPHWSDNCLMGAPQGSGLSMANLLKALLTPIMWNNHVYGIAVLLACAALVYFLQKRGLGWFAACCASVAAFWVGSNLTLLYGGHVLKPYVVFFFTLSLLPVAGAAAGSIGYALLWGCCVGMMFVQQPDIAFFFALSSGAYLVCTLWQRSGFKWELWLKVLAPAAVAAILFAAGPLLDGYEHQVKGVAQMETQNPTEKWDYITQWSLPPDELGMLVAPGYFGWRSGEPEGPYWGRIGQSPGWEKTHQGMQNFKLDDGYLGIIPVAFAVFALFASFRSPKRKEIWFWSGAAIIALLLSMGRYSILYKLFYQLPVVNNIRAPIKFLQVFQVCVAILAAYGIHFLLDPDRDRKIVRRGLWGMAVLSGILLIMLLGAQLGMGESIASFSGSGWPADQARTMAANKAGALAAASIMAVIMAAVFAIMAYVKPETANRLRGWLGAVLVLTVAVDAVRFSKHYIKEMPRSYIEANALTDFLHANLGDQRIAFLSQQGIDNIWITYLMPYNRILNFNFTDMPRMANDYKALLSAGQRNPLNMWRFSAVKYLLAPGSMEQQLAGAGCRKVFAYGLSDAGHGEFTVVQQPNGPLAVFELPGSLPRYALFAGSQKVSDDQLLPAALANLDRVYLPEDSPLPLLAGTGQIGDVTVVSSTPGKVRLKVNAGVPAILRVAEKYDPDWKASIDGKSAKVERVDYLCQGVAIPPGAHEVRLWYAPSRMYFLMQCSGMLILASALVMVYLRRKGGDAAD